MPPWKLKPLERWQSEVEAQRDQHEQNRADEDQHALPQRVRAGAGGVLHRLGAALKAPVAPDAQRQRHDDRNQVVADQEDPDVDIAEAAREQRLGHVDTAVGHRDRMEQLHVGGGICTPEGRGRRHRFGHHRVDDEDPDQQRDVAERLDIDRHQLGDDPVLRQPQHPGDDAEHRGPGAGDRGDEQRVEQPDQHRAGMGAVVRILDEVLVDIVACARAQEAVVEVLAQRMQVLDRVVDQPGRARHEKEHEHHLDGHRPVPGVVDEHAHPKGGFRRLVHRCHC